MHAYKGISLRQPMAFLIMSGVKDVENRYLNVTYRGPLLIHVSKTQTDLNPATWGPVTRRAMKQLGFDAKLSDCADAVRKALEPTLGRVVGVVELVDVIQESRSEWANSDESHWVLSNPRAVAKPFEAAGNTSMVNFETKKRIQLADGSELPGLDELVAAPATPTPKTSPKSTTATASPTRSREGTPAKSDIEDIETVKVLSAIRAVLTEHTELSREELVRQVARKLGYDRTGHRIDEAVRGHLRAAIRRRIAVAVGVDVVRVDAADIGDYSLDELRHQLVAQLRKGETIAREDLITQTARALGFARVGSTIEQRLKSAINSAIRHDELGAESGNAVRRS